jgi:PST family polysaccharide transporter
MSSPSSQPEIVAGLRSSALRGGAYLAGRQLVGMLLSLAAVLVTTRVIGPAKYGIYAAALGICATIQNLGTVGIGVYLVRQPGEADERDYHLSSTVLGVLGVSMALATLALVPVIVRWVNIPGLGPVLRVMTLSLVFQLFAIPANARLERALDYRRVALIDLTAQVIYVLLTFVLAVMGAGAWALVAGFCLQQAAICLGAHRAAKYRPRFHWDSARFRHMAHYAMGFFASQSVWQFRNLANPMIVGHFLGAADVGYVSIAIRMIELLTFMKNAAWRISFAVLGRVQHDTRRMLLAINEGMKLLNLAVGPVLVIFGLIGVWVMPLAFGVRWQPAMRIFPFIALSYLTNSLFNLQQSALYVIKKNWQVTEFNLANVILFLGAAWTLVPRLGINGYGWAEVVSLASYGVIHLSTRKYIGRLDYGMVGLWWSSLSAALFWQYLGLWIVLLPAAVLLWPATLRQLRGYALAMRGAAYGA